MHYLILILWLILLPRNVTIAKLEGRGREFNIEIKTNGITLQLCVFKIALKKILITNIVHYIKAFQAGC